MKYKVKGPVRTRPGQALIRQMIIEKTLTVVHRIKEWDRCLRNQVGPNMNRSGQ